ncbi:hypothetical protein A3850_005125 [Lewinella sp. 4G2]|nr:hypothetical protein A3850_005125 [Lewinella sp. 4G2]
MASTSFLFHLTAGLELFGGHPNLTVDGYYSRQRLAYKSASQPGYGYLYLQNAESDLDILDYNTELNGQVKVKSPHMPIAYGTPDIFSAVAHGIGGQFSVKRNDLGQFRPGRSRNGSTSAELGLELGAGLFAHFGGDITVTGVEVTKGDWEHNEAKPFMRFTEGSGVYEASYLSMDSELNHDENDYTLGLNQDKPALLNVKKSGNRVVAKNAFLKQSDNGRFTTAQNLSSNVNNATGTRKKRTQAINYLTAADANAVGLDRKIKSYPKNTRTYSTCNVGNVQKLERIDGARKAHHISEINITQPSGQRYVFGHPVYNTKQREVSFSVDTERFLPGTKSPTSSNYGLVKYQGNDNSTRNNVGKDKYFNAKEMPGYANAYLLSAILSPDYIDRTGDGISDDDNGDAVKFNYTRSDASFKWRSPFLQNTARYHENLISLNADDKASYLYGEKELWYAHSIESRNMVAFFHTEDRQDARGVAGENGGLNNSEVSQRLQKIELFTKAELRASETIGREPVPIKTVHFEYDYSLCPGIPNTSQPGSGKLTLKKVYFTYGKSLQGAFNKYEFEYNDAFNFPYNGGQYNRWGTRQVNPTTGTQYPANHLYPYVLQGDAGNLTQANTQAWNLTKITNPSGGEITITYESDDYAYVQDARAGQMFPIVGFAKTGDPIGPGAANLYTSPSDLMDRVVVKVPQGYTQNDIGKAFLENVDKIYFDCKVDLNKRGQDERVKGYMTYDKSGGRTAQIQGNYLSIPIKLLDTKRNGQKVNPITFAALQVMRSYRPELAYPGIQSDDEMTEGALKAALQSLAGLGQEIGNLIRGFEKNSMKKGWGKEVAVTNNESWLRLCNPDYKKLGGGSRVKEIKISDKWADQVGVDAVYGQRYTYTTTKVVNGEEITISSGVASFEPANGGEENLMRQPLEYEDHQALAPKSLHYSETPIGESLFPSPSVGYSEVKVEDIANDGDLRSHTGYKKHFFYTAKDFPTIVRNTTPKSVRVKPNPLLKFLKINVVDAMGMSQGFSVETNNMHGQVKGMASHDRNGGLLSSSTYHYRTKANGQLESNVSTVDASGTINDREIGVTTKVWQELFEEKSDTKTGGLALNGDAFPIVIFPALVIAPWPKIQTQKKKFAGAVTTKLIHRQGMIDRVTVTENGSSITSSNTLYDDYTGEVLLSTTENEFGDPVYNFSYPAHWAYEGMGSASQNIGAFLKNVTLNEGTVTGTSSTLVNKVLEPGDELLAVNSSDGGYAVRYFTAEVEGALKIIDASGEVVDRPAVDLKVIRSGFRNMLTTTVGNVQTLESPIVGNSVRIDPASPVINASAMTYGDTWTIPCGANQEICGEEEFIPEQINPYIEGMLGNWRPEKTYALLNQRTPEIINGSPRIRTSGSLVDFAPAWVWSGNNLAFNQNGWYNGGWRQASTATLFDTRGNQLEQFDALNIYSSALFGYNGTLATAVAANSKYEEIFFDGFEDYDFSSDCGAAARLPKNMKLFVPEEAPEGVNLTRTEAHTGKYSMEINPLARQQAIVNLTDCRGIGKEPQVYVSNPDTVFKTTCESCLPILNPSPDKDYYLSAWVATETSKASNALPQDIGINVLFANSGVAVAGVPTGPVIEGWQRIEAHFTAPASAPQMFISFANRGDEKAYVDDFRFQPLLGSMKSYVYDPFSLRLMATLDENNYATFYEYDDEGKMIRLKRETDSGIQTVQEERTVLKRGAK